MEKTTYPAQQTKEQSQQSSSDALAAMQSATLPNLATGSGFESMAKSSSRDVLLPSPLPTLSSDRHLLPPLLAPHPPPSTLSENPTENQIEEEHIKQLQENIYNDCLKYFSKFNTSSGDLESD